MASRPAAVRSSTHGPPNMLAHETSAAGSDVHGTGHGIQSPPTSRRHWAGHARARVIPPNTNAETTNPRLLAKKSTSESRMTGTDITARRWESGGIATHGTEAKRRSAGSTGIRVTDPNRVDSAHSTDTAAANFESVCRTFESCRAHRRVRPFPAVVTSA